MFIEPMLSEQSSGEARNGAASRSSIYSSLTSEPRKNADYATDVSATM